MNESRKNFAVGLFMIGGIAVLGYLMVLFGEAPGWLGGAEYELRIEVNEITGIDDGTPIYLNGIKVGRVTTLKFLEMTRPEMGVVLIGKIRKEFSIPKGARAECISPTLGIGRGRVDIFASGGTGHVEPGGAIHGVMINSLERIFPPQMATSFESTVKGIGNFAEAYAPVAKDIHELLKVRTVEEVDKDPQKVAANLYTAVQRLDQVLKSFDGVIGDADMRNKLREVMDNLLTMTADAKLAMSDLRETTAALKVEMAKITTSAEQALTSIDSRVNELADATLPTLDHAAKTASNLHRVSQKIADGEGTLGRLLNDERLYEATLLAIQRIQDMVDSFRRLADRFERRGRIGLEVGGFPVDQPLSEPQ
jgi:phospholipid/cholesterol/gamma-HCH transport system substrate-binding protein